MCTMILKLALTMSLLSFWNGSHAFFARAQSAQCVDDFETVYTDTTLREAFSLLTSSFLDRCGSDPDLCESDSENTANLTDSYTLVRDWRGLESSSNYTSYLEVCQDQGFGSRPDFVPVLVDYELLYAEENGNSRVRLVSIHRAFCLPAACAWSVEDLTDAILSFEGNNWEDLEVSHLNFHLLDLPPEDSNAEACDLREATFGRLDVITQQAHNKYVDEFVEACGNGIDENEDYCSLLYRSSGEYDVATFKYFNYFSSPEYEAYEKACEDAGGEICAFDLIYTFQSHVSGNELNRLDQNIVYQGFPECFPKTCEYQEKKQIVERAHLPTFLEGLTAEERIGSRRKLISYPEGKVAATGTANAGRKMMAKHEMTGNFLRGLIAQDGEEVAKRDDTLDLSLIDVSKAKEGPIPVELIYGDKRPEGRVFNVYYGNDCGEYESCYARITNFCLRGQVEETRSTGDEPEDGPETTDDEEEDNGFINIVPFP